MRTRTSFKALCALAFGIVAIVPAATAADTNRTPAGVNLHSTTCGMQYQPTLKELQTRVYRVPGWKDFQFYTLKNGWSCLGTDSAHLDDAKLGDLNGDGLRDAIVVISYNGGGTGTLTYLFALINDGKRLYQSCDGYSLHNSQLKSISLQNKKLSLRFLAQKDDDPNLAAPTVNKFVQLKLNIPPLSSLKPRPQPDTAKFQKLAPAMAKVITGLWNDGLKSWKEYENMSEKDFQEKFSVCHGPRIDYTTRPKWQEPPKGSKPVVLDFILREYGYAGDVQLTTPSGIQIYDQTVLDTVSNTDFQDLLTADPNLLGIGGELHLHVRVTYAKPIKVEFINESMPSLGDIFPKEQ